MMANMYNNEEEQQRGKYSGHAERQEKTYYGRRQYPGPRNIEDIEATPSIVEQALCKAQEEGYVDKDKKVEVLYRGRGGR